ncbi:hypothetical protein MTO96_018547 [Rhipicephalus appendiculatus]
MSGAISFNVVEDPSASNEDMRVLRASFDNADDAEAWMKKYSAESRTSWILESVCRFGTRMVFHKMWSCHLSHRNKSRPSSLEKPACPAKLSIKIKKVTRSTKRNDMFLRLVPPLPAVIRLISTHNHKIECADAPMSTRPTPEARLKFEGYFELGMNPSEAKRHNERLLLAAGDSGADGPANPKLSSLYCWYNQWRSDKYGSPENPLPKLTEKATAYASSGADIKLSGTSDSWAVLLVTPIMHRAQQLKSSGDLIFVDTVTSCDATKSMVTLFLTATKAGAVPIAAFIHKEQDTEGYLKAFDLLRTDYPLCFGNQQHPAAFVTDCSVPLKTALLRTWPGARQLLCHIRILQAEWRRLNSSDVPKQEHSQLFSSFRKVLNAKSHEELARAKEELCRCNHKVYMEQAGTFFTREREWSLPSRVSLTAENWDVAAYSEVSVRILKDVLLSKMQLYNAVALLDFIATECEAYLKARILQHTRPISYADHQWGGLLFDKPRKASQQPDAGNAHNRRECTIQYDLGLCSCWPGIQGAFCKHQAFLVHEFKLPFPCTPELTTEECEELVTLAIGRRSMSPTSSPNQQTCNLDSVLNGGEEDIWALLDHDYLKEAPGDPGDSNTELPKLEIQVSACVEISHDEALVTEEQSYQALVSSLRQVHELAKDVPGYVGLVDRIVTEVKDLTTSNAAYGFLLRLDASATAERRPGVSTANQASQEATSHSSA